MVRGVISDLHPVQLLSALKQVIERDSLSIDAQKCQAHTAQFRLALSKLDVEFCDRRVGNDSRSGFAFPRRCFNAQPVFQRFKNLLRTCDNFNVDDALLLQTLISLSKVVTAAALQAVKKSVIAIDKRYERGRRRRPLTADPAMRFPSSSNIEILRESLGICERMIASA